MLMKSLIEKIVALLTGYEDSETMGKRLEIRGIKEDKLCFFDDEKQYKVLVKKIYIFHDWRYISLVYVHVPQELLDTFKSSSYAFFGIKLSPTWGFWDSSYEFVRYVICFIEDNEDFSHVIRKTDDYIQHQMKLLSQAINEQNQLRKEKLKQKAY